MEGLRRITIMGLGVMGGSMALGLKSKGFQGEIIGWDRSPKTINQAKTAGAVDRGYQDPRLALKDTELVVLATPVGTYGDILEKIAPFLSPRMMVTDVGSVKGYVEKVIKDSLPENIPFIGGHPMAGSEQSGFTAADAELYQGATYFLTPGPRTPAGTLEKIKNFVKALGAEPVVINIKEHDEIVARISHIPQLSAVLLTSMLQGEEHQRSRSFVGGGFKDSTRIASGNPRMWKDIFLLNKEEVLSGIETLEELLKAFKSHLKEGEEEKILQRLEGAKTLRDEISKG